MLSCCFRKIILSENGFILNGVNYDMFFYREKILIW